MHSRFKIFTTLAVVLGLLALALPAAAQESHSVTITQDQFDRAFAAFAQRTDGVDYLTVEIAGEQLLYRIGLRDALGEIQPMFAASWHQAITHLVGSDGGAGDVVGSSELWSADSITMEATGEPAPAPLAQRAVRAISRATNQVIAQRVGLDTVTEVTGFPGGLTFHMAAVITDPVGVPPRGSNPERHAVSEAQFNRAFTTMAVNSNLFDSLSVSLEDSSVRFTLTTPMVCASESIEGVFDFANPDIDAASVVGGFDSTPLFFRSLTCAGESLDPAEARLGNFEIQDLMIGAFRRVVRAAAGENQVIGMELDAGRKVVVLVYLGGALGDENS